MKRFYLAAIISLFSLAACDHKQPKVEHEVRNNPATAVPNTHPESTKLKLNFHSSGESFYSDIQLDDGKLAVTYFTDSEQRCAQWYKSQPCWNPTDLETITTHLTPEQQQELTKLIQNSGLMQLEGDRFGAQNLRERAYSEKLTVQLGAVERHLVYRSRPDADPKPIAFAQVESALRQYLPAKTGKVLVK